MTSPDIVVGVPAAPVAEYVTRHVCPPAGAAALVTGSLAGVGLTVPAAYVFYRSWSTEDLSFLLMDSFSRNV
ncbi:hypothetical protein MTQ22_06760, partial [Corynebacterium bovis]|uniref:hypothetical protein n=1 Tax=Corynebacterium bovis TaxID=36808 RepID=UPI003138B810